MPRRSAGWDRSCSTGSRSFACRSSRRSTARASAADWRLALACRYRICTDHPKTALALPEVQLGLIPGHGRHAATAAAGRAAGGARHDPHRAKRAREKALQMGLVDEMVHPAILREIAIDRARGLAAGSRTSDTRDRNRGATSLLLEHNPIGRGVVFRKARESVLEKTHGHYPAPLAALDAVQAGYARGFAAGLQEEARLFGEMAVTDVSRQLVFLFFATNALKKDSGVDVPAPPPRGDHKLGVLGAGFMGAGIASIAAQQGTLVRLKDTDTARIGKGLAAIARRDQGAAHAKADHAAAVRRLHESRRRHDRLLGLRVRRPRDRSGVRGSRAQAPRARGGRAGRSTALPSTRRTRARFRSRGSPRWRSIPSACSACTSSRRCTRCRCSR